MTPLQNLYYAIGELAYAVAKADGRVQAEEKKKFHDLVAEEVKKENFSFDISDIIFQIMTKDKASLPDSYHWAIRELKLNSHYLSPKIKASIVSVMEKVAAFYPPVTIEESKLIEKFKKEIEPLQGDPLFFK